MSKELEKKSQVKTDMYAGEWNVYMFQNSGLDPEDEYLSTAQNLTEAMKYCKEYLENYYVACPTVTKPLSAYKLVEHPDEEKSEHEFYKIPESSNSLLIKLAYANEDNGDYCRIFAVPKGRYEDMNASEKSYKDYNNID